MECDNGDHSLHLVMSVILDYWDYSETVEEAAPPYKCTLNYQVIKGGDWSSPRLVGSQASRCWGFMRGGEEVAASHSGWTEVDWMAALR